VIRPFSVPGGYASFFWIVLMSLAASSPLSAAQPSPPGSDLGLNAGDNGKPLTIEADQGIEWQQANHVYIAHGHAKASRGTATIYADTLSAYYRPSPAAAAPSTPTPPAPTAADGLLGNGSNQIYLVEADGHVRIVTPTETASGDHLAYDVEKAVAVLTGSDLKLVTERDTVTARDSLEWYDGTHLAVARGKAVAHREGREMRADILTAEIVSAPSQPSHIGKIDGSGHVFVSSQDQIARGDAGVYDLDSGIATLTGNVTLTRADNELRGRYAVFDVNRNIARLLSAPPNAGKDNGNRVEGLLVPHRKPEPPKPKAPPP